MTLVLITLSAIGIIFFVVMIVGRVKRFKELRQEEKRIMSDPRTEAQHYRESLHKIINVTSCDKAKYIASRALGRYKNERA